MSIIEDQLKTLGFSKNSHFKSHIGTVTNYTCPKDVYGCMMLEGLQVENITTLCDILSYGLKDSAKKSLAEMFNNVAGNMVADKAFDLGFTVNGYTYRVFGNKYKHLIGSSWTIAIITCLNINKHLLYESNKTPVMDSHWKLKDI